MKLVRYLYEGKTAYGELVGEAVRPLEGAPYDGVRYAEGEPLPLPSVKLLCPVAPGKILGIGLNYRDHAIEMKKPLPAEPTVFLKPTSCLVGDGDTVYLPPLLTHQVEHESELVVVIGKRARNVPQEQALAYVLGYTCGNDVSARDLQNSGTQWDFCKGYDTFGPVGPWVETGLGDGSGLDLTMRVNGQVRQHSNTNQLVFGVPFLIHYLSQWMTLEPGDILFTGTPHGVSPLKDGDVMEVEIQGIGVLRNPVKQG